MTSLCDARTLTVTATTKRLPEMAGGMRGGEAQDTDIGTFYIMPIFPASTDVQMRSMTQTPFALFETYTGDHDIRHGDILISPATVGDAYNVRGVEMWPYSGSEKFYHLILEKLRT